MARVRVPNFRVAAEHIALVANGATNVVSLWRETNTVLARAVPHYMAPCWFTLDPAALLATSHFQEGLPEIPPEWLAQEYLEEDYNKMAEVASSASGISSLEEATEGEPARSPRYRDQMVPWGAGHELLVALRTGGDTWAMLGLYRELGAEPFTPAEREFLWDIAPHLARGARQALLVGESTEPIAEDSPGMLILTNRLERDSATALAERWLDELQPPGVTAALPVAVNSVAAAVVAGEPAPTVRVRSRAGRWFVIHGARLTQDQIGIVMEPASPSRVAGILMAAYGLSSREQELTALALRGRGTREIADQLSISPHTVQQHFKSIFEKTGVNSRRDLVGKVFFSHYEPRLRDNERRAADGRPLRYSPIP